MAIKRGNYVVSKNQDGKEVFALNLWNLPPMEDVEIVIPAHTIEKIKKGIEEKRAGR